MALGGGAPASASHAEEAFAALGARVTEPARDAKYDAARVRIAEAALVPSRVWRDSSAWTSSVGARRTLSVQGRFSGSRYELNAVPVAPAPAAPAESQHVIHLTRLADANEFAWDTDVFYAIGSVSAAAVGAMFRALLSSGEGKSERQIRADYKATIPVASATLGQLFRVDSIRTTHLPDSSTLAVFALTITPAGVESRYPAFAKYMRRYGGTARTRWTLSDQSGTPWLALSLHDGHMTFRVRSQRGQVVPLSGTSRPIPDSLALTGDFTMPVSFFTSGFRDLRTRFTLTRTAHEVGFTIVSREEPRWVLPLITERLLRTPLRRPFQGEGALFGMSVTDTTGAQSILRRQLHLEVKESGILRFITRLTTIALSDYRGAAEREQMAWLREVFTALTADVRKLTP
ncbi:MAG: hypothetical protein WD801_01500 [Gemmatimonadaceae bacterium]